MIVSYLARAEVTVFAVRYGEKSDVLVVSMSRWLHLGFALAAGDWLLDLLHSKNKCSGHCEWLKEPKGIVSLKPSKLPVAPMFPPRNA